MKVVAVVEVDSEAGAALAGRGVVVSGAGDRANAREPFRAVDALRE